MRPITSFMNPTSKQLLDLDLGAYTLVTYRPSDLHPDLRKGIDVVVVKRLTHPQEVQTLLTMVGNRNVEPEWTTTFGGARHQRGCPLTWD